MGPAIIRTERMELRSWTESDDEAMLFLGSDPLVMRFITGGRPLKPTEAAEFVARQIDAQETRGWCRWVLQLRDPLPEEPAGMIGFCGPGCTFTPEIEVGWWLASELWGRGLATEAARAAVDYCFDVIGFPRLISAIAPFNVASRRVAEKSGFALESEFLHHGERVLRYSQHNPLPERPLDPRFRLDCEGAPTTSVLDGSET